MLHGDTRIADLTGCADFTPELIDSILEEGCHYGNGVVRTPKGLRDAYRTFREGGSTGIACDPQ